MKASVFRVIHKILFGTTLVLLMINSTLAEERVQSRSFRTINTAHIGSAKSLDRYRARNLRSYRRYQRRFLRGNQRNQTIGRYSSRRNAKGQILYYLSGYYYVRRGCRLSLYRSHIRAGRRIRLGEYRAANLHLCKPIRIRRIDARTPWRQTRHLWLSHIRPSPTYPTLGR